MNEDTTFCSDDDVADQVANIFTFLVGLALFITSTMDCASGGQYPRKTWASLLISSVLFFLVHSFCNGGEAVSNPDGNGRVRSKEF